MTARRVATEPEDRPPADPRPTSAAVELLTRRRAIGAWCDQHLAAMHTLSSLILDDPSITRSGLGELLDEPRGTRESGSAQAVHQPPRTGSRPCAVPAAHTVRPDRCPDGVRPDDRVELALRLMGDRTSAVISQALGLPEGAVTARLRRGLWILFAPCGRAGIPRPAHR